MNLTRLAIDNDRLTLVLVLAVIAAGASAFFTMPRAYDPGFIVRTAQVVTHFPGAAPERVEQLVSSPLETAIRAIPELDYVTSESRSGVSIVVVHIRESHTRMQPIWDRLRTKVEDAAIDLPADVIGPHVDDEFGDVFGIVFTITGEGFGYAELEEVAEDVRDALQRIPDAARVEILGSREERVFVDYDNARLADLGISPGQLSESLSTRNIVIPGGSFTLGPERIALEPSGNFESIEDIGRTIVNVPGSDRLLYLRDIARVSSGYVDPPDSIVHSSGQRALAVAVSMREGGNNTVLGEQVTALLDRLERSYPWGIEFDMVNFSPADVSHKVEDFVASLGQAVAVVTVVLLLFLGLRTGLVVAALIPLTMLMALMVMDLLHIGLDQISLAALIIALGMLVDNGIVMSESITVQMENGKPPMQAAVDSAGELRIPLLTASLTTAAAFLPIYLAESNVGEFTASLFKVVTITLLCSWVVALTVVPMLCLRFVRVAPGPTGFDRGLYPHYRRLLRLLLRHRAITLAAAGIVFAVSMLGFGAIPNVFFPPSDRAYFKVELELPTGTGIETTEAVVSSIEAFIESDLRAGGERQDGVTNWVSYVGNSGPRFILAHNPKPSNPAYALMVVNVNRPEAIDGAMRGLQRFALARHPDLDLKTRRIENGPAIPNPVEVRISGNDTDLVFGAVEELKRELQRLGGLENIADDWGQRIKKLDIRVDQPRALRAGVSSEDIAVSLQAGLGGLQLTEYRKGEELVPVLLRSTVANQDDIGKIESLSVYAPATGRAVPLGQVADVELVWDTARIHRRDGVRTVTVGAQLADGVTASEKFDGLAPWLAGQRERHGPQLRFELGGEHETSAKANRSIMDNLPIAAMIILVLLVAQFNSLRKSLIILATIPLALIGVIIGLLAAGSYFGFMTLLGIVSLAGIVINNAIVLLERIQLERDGGTPPERAVIAAAQQRARPILLTTATTVLGLIPLLLGGGAMWEPMAISIMGGLLFATLLTLGVVPVLYALLFRIEAVPPLAHGEPPHGRAPDDPAR